MKDLQMLQTDISTSVTGVESSLQSSNLRIENIHHDLGDHTTSLKRNLSTVTENIERNHKHQVESYNKQIEHISRLESAVASIILMETQDKEIHFQGENYNVHLSYRGILD